MADQAVYFDQALEENVQRVVRGMDGQCLEAKQHFEDERDARSDLLDAMYEDLLAKFLADTEVLSFANLGLFIFVIMFYLECVRFLRCSNRPRGSRSRTPRSSTKRERRTWSALPPTGLPRTIHGRCVYCYVCRISMCSRSVFATTFLSHLCAASYRRNWTVKCGTLC